MRPKLSLPTNPPSHPSMPPISTPTRRPPNHPLLSPPSSDTQLISMVDDYLTKRIDYVHQSRSNELQELTRIKNSLQQKLGEIKVNPEDIPYKRVGNYNNRVYQPMKPYHSGSMRREYEQKVPTRGVDMMMSFENQIDQCDRLLSDLGAKCREYASMESVKVPHQPRYKIKTEFRNEGEPRDRKLPLLKSKRANTEEVYSYQQQDMEMPMRKKYDHTGDALIVVPPYIGEASENRRSEAPTSRNPPYIPTRSRRSSVDQRKETTGSHQKKREAEEYDHHQREQDHQTIEHKRKKSITIDFECPEEDRKRIQESAMSFNPLKVKGGETSHNKTIDKNINTNDSYLRSHPRIEEYISVGTQNEFPSSEYQKPPTHKTPRIHQNLRKQEQTKSVQRDRSRSKQRENPNLPSPQQQRSNQLHPINKEDPQYSRQLTQKSHNSKSKSKQSKHSSSSYSKQRATPPHLSKQKSIIPHLSLAKMRGLKLYERIKQYKSKASIK